MRRARFQALLAIVTIATVARAAGPTEHEFIPPDPREDVMLGTTTTVGDLPSAIETQSGLVTAPDPFRMPSSSERAYSRVSTPETSLFFPDRDTRRVPEVEYDDPFSPALTPYKRLSAFDAVNSDYTLRVADPNPRKVTIGGSIGPGEDAFYGDMTVDLVAGEPVRIPSVSAGARILRLHTVPQTDVELLRDGADNLFVRGAVRTRVRLLLEIAAPRSAFGGPIRDALWSDLPVAPPLPKNVQADADEVARQIGVSRALSYRDVIERLVAYHRSFSPSDEPIGGKSDVYLDIATSKRGVCRHRGFSFVITALGLKIPARLVTNEAHAWVEVNDGAGWHRIDLGGAADAFNDGTANDRLTHTPPKDPFAWPPGSRPGREVAQATRPGGPQPSGSSSAAPARSAPSPASSAPGTGPGLLGDAPQDDSDPRPRANIRVSVGAREVHRNDPLEMEGKVDSAAGACSYLRLDVVLVGPKEQIPLGSIATDGDGNFQGAVIVPPNVGVGEYDVVLTTPGDARCGKGRSE